MLGEPNTLRITAGALTLNGRPVETLYIEQVSPRLVRGLFRAGANPATVVTALVLTEPELLLVEDGNIGDSFAYRPCPPPDAGKNVGGNQ
jgi:hypothetical protein